MYSINFSRHTREQMKCPWLRRRKTHSKVSLSCNALENLDDWRASSKIQSYGVAFQRKQESRCWVFPSFSVETRTQRSTFQRRIHFGSPFCNLYIGWNKMKKQNSLLLHFWHSQISCATQTHSHTFTFSFMLGGEKTAIHKELCGKFRSSSIHHRNVSEMREDGERVARWGKKKN